MARLSRRYAAALLAGACVACLGACSPASEGGTDQPSPDTSSASYLVQQTGDGEPATGTRSSSTAPSTTSTTPASTTSSTPTTTTNTLPGGTAPTAALAEAGYLRAGRIALGALREAAEAGAFADDDSTDNDPTGGVAFEAGPPATDLCDYLFGTAAEVATLTRLTGKIHLAPLSGPHLTAGTDAAAAPTGMVVACVYASDDAPQVVLQVGTGAPVDTDLPGQPVIVDGDEVQAVLSYAPDHAGVRIDPSTARDWLTAALGRVAAGS